MSRALGVRKRHRKAVQRFAADSRPLHEIEDDVRRFLAAEGVLHIDSAEQLEAEVRAVLLMLSTAFSPETEDREAIEVTA